MSEHFNVENVIPEQSWNYEKLIGKDQFCILTRIDPNSGSDMAIMEVWKNHLIQQRLPYAVVSGFSIGMKRPILQLWKRAGVGLKKEENQ